MIRPICSCGNLCKTNGTSPVDGRRLYKTYCSPCSKNKHGVKGINLRRFKKEKCESCGFDPVHSCQLDVDHKDGDRSNEAPSNLVTLCANCHRLKTYLNKDWIPTQNKKGPTH